MRGSSHAADPVPPLLHVRALRVGFGDASQAVFPVDGVSFDLVAGRILCLVGESGSGKSLTALALMRLLAVPPARIEAEALRFDGSDLLALDAQAMTALRGDRLAMIFQEPMTSLNPVFTIGRQIAEVLIEHRGLAQAEAMRQAGELLRRVKIPAPEARLASYPHQLSGGMRQRVMIAMALACGPRLLIADEPTTALDVTIQAQILELMRELARETGAAIILITHDLGVVAEMAQRVVVMYAGRKVEEARVEELFARPRHPYTRGLLGSMPHLGDSVRGEGGKRLVEIPGMVPSLKDDQPGCLFAPRCPNSVARCLNEVPPLTAHGPGHWAACWNPVQ